METKKVETQTNGTGLTTLAPAVLVWGTEHLTAEQAADLQSKLDLRPGYEFSEFIFRKAQPGLVKLKKGNVVVTLIIDVLPTGRWVPTYELIEEAFVYPR